jgi:asparaginyl-tRNA synthetase
MNYPKAINALYMRLNDDGRTAAAMDVLAPGIGEIIGGSQREERLEVLDRIMAERGIDQEHYAWDRDLRHYGTVPHAGFGRDAMPFPRISGNARY